jgi:hypothetical protein
VTLLTFIIEFQWTNLTQKSLQVCIVQRLLKKGVGWLGVRFMVFNATINNISVISWQSVSLVEETGVLRENQRPAASH